MSNVNEIDTGHLQSFIDRIERLEDEKSALVIDIKEVYSEAKGTGFDVKIMRKIVALRKMDASDRDEQEYLMECYRKALNI